MSDERPAQTGSCCGHLTHALVLNSRNLPSSFVEPPRRCPYLVEYFMVRFFAVAVVLSCLASSAWAQAQPAPGTPATPAATPAIKKQSPNKAAAKPSVPAANGPCDL